MRQSKPRALLPAWLLLLLREGDSYGRVLCERLNELGLAVDTSTTYRMLRALDQEGAITSHWTKSDIGPARRSYRLTPEGRRRLGELAASVTASCELHERFLHEYERVRAGHDPRSTAHRLTGQDPAVASAPFVENATAGLPRELFTAWLLLLLDEAGRSYGYGLRRALHDRNIDTDRAALYRLLRALESDGWLQSDWVPPADGPRRRSYQLTAEGRRNLDKLVAVITAERDGLAAFLHAYQEP